MAALPELVDRIVDLVEHADENALTFADDAIQPRFWTLWNAEFDAQFRNLSRWLSAPGVQPIHIARLLRATGQVAKRKEGDWFMAHAAEHTLRRSVVQCSRGSLLEFARAFEAVGIPVSVLIERWYSWPYARLTKGWPDDAVWPFFIAYPEAIDTGFTTSSPSQDLLKALMTLKGRAEPSVQAKIREIARKVVDDIMKRLKARVETALTGTRNRFASSPLKNMRNFDWRRTIRENLKNYDVERRVLVAERLRFHARSRRRFPWTIVLCVDQSGSMVSSVVYSAVMAAIIAGLPSLKLHLVVFDTAIVDLTDRASDPVEVLLSVQLGGGTDIGRAVTYCEQLIVQPTRTVFVLVSDFCEGGSPARLVGAVRRLAEARVTLLGLAALDEQAVPDFDRTTAHRLADAGMKIAALTSERFADWLAEVIR